MATYCPRTGRRVVYLTCMECDTQECRGQEREYCSAENKNIQLHQQKGESQTCLTTKPEKKND